jgi:hypothetical protein
MGSEKGDPFCCISSNKSVSEGKKRGPDVDEMDDNEEEAVELRRTGEREQQSIRVDNGGL